MKARNDRVVLITGASSGIGQACAAHLAKAGYRVYGASRKPPSDAPIPELTLDVRDDGSVEDDPVVVVGLQPDLAEQQLDLEGLAVHLREVVAECRRVLRRQPGGGHVVSRVAVAAKVGIAAIATDCAIAACDMSINEKP